MSDLSLSWLDDFFGKGIIQDEGTPLPSRGALNFVGSGVTATDDAANNRTNVTIGQGGTALNAGTGTLNDVSTLISGAPAAAVRFSGATPTVNGFANGTDGRPLIVYGAGQPVVLANEATGSVATNRITTGTGGSVTLNADQGALLVYDVTSTRWRIAGIFSAALTDGPTITATATGTINNSASDSSGTPAEAIRFTGVAPSLTGVAGGTASRKLILEAVGGPLTVQNSNAGSLAANQILTGTGGDMVVAVGGAVLLVYDAVSSIWRVSGGGGFSTSGTIPGVLYASGLNSATADPAVTVPAAGKFAFGYDSGGVGANAGMGTIYVFSRPTSGPETFGTALLPGPGGGFIQFSNLLADQGGFNSVVGASFYSQTAGNVTVAIWGASGGVPYFGDPTMLAPTQIYCGGQGRTSQQNGCNFVLGTTGKISFSGTLYAGGTNKFLNLDASGNVLPTSTLSGVTLASPTITGTTTYQGTRYKVTDLVGELQTSTSSANQVITGATYTMANETVATFEAVVHYARRTNVTKAGKYVRVVTYRRTGGGAPTIVGAIETGTDQETTAADDVTFTVSGNIVQVACTPADTDGRNWSCELTVRETTAA